jgi:hypothetical protein
VKDLPNPFWALLFMALGCALLMGCLFKIEVNTTTVMLGVIMAVATAGTNLISGAFGYINGHKDGVASVSIPTQSSPTSATTVVMGDPTQAENPPNQQK